MLTSYSNSSLDSFRSCPRKFKFRYIEKVEVPEAVSADTYLGNAVHRVLAHLYTLASDGVLWPMEKAIDSYMEEWDKPQRKSISVPNENLTVDDYVRNGREMLEKYYRRFQPFRDGTLLGVEMNLGYRLPDTPFKFSGRIDRLWKRPDGVVEVIDYKTGKHLPQSGEESAIPMQMGMYQLLVHGRYPQFEKIELVQYFLKMEEAVRFRMEPEQADELAERIRQDIVASLTAEKLDSFPTQESNMCHYCEYFHLCPAKRHQLILEGESGHPAGTEERTTMKTASELADKYIELDAQIKELKSEHEALKEDLVQAAKDLSLDKFVGSDGSVTVKLGRDEKFIGKSKDPESFAELSHLARELHLDDCFSLDTTALKDVYAKQRLNSEQLEQLRKYIEVQETSRVTVRRKKKSDDDSE
jgi:putative RecB family exonuclease